MLPLALPWYYLSAADVHRLAGQLPVLFPNLCELIRLPQTSFEGRPIVGVRVGRTPTGNTKSILLTGNVHARELGGAEFCLYLAYNLCVAYTQGESLMCGNRTITATEVSIILENLDLVIVPCVNPDGREYSMAGAHAPPSAKALKQALWRGNRNVPPGNCNGVNLNRNQDFLWQFETHFAPNAGVQTTTNPCDDFAQNYRGAAPTSEPETQNLVWLMDEIPSLCAYIDVHSAYGAIVYPWGDDHIQKTKPGMNFLNPAFDGRRNPQAWDTLPYGEYMPAADLDDFKRLAAAFCDSLAEVRGTTYKSMPSLQLDASVDAPCQKFYRPASGANDDYAYSRHFSDASKSKVYAFTVEFGRPLPGTSDADDLRGFQPSWQTEMGAIVEELIAGTVGFCIEVDRSLPVSANVANVSESMAIS